MRSRRIRDVVNFAGGRGTKLREFVASPRNNASLSDSLTAQQIEVRTVRSFSRVGDKIETTTIAQPVMFTEPEVDQNANEIRFAMCLDLKDAKAGSYVGQVRVAGPRGLSRASAAITVNAQNNTLFLYGLVLTLVIALVVMVVRGVTSKQKAVRLAGTAVVSLAAAGCATYRIYSGDPAWGADTTESILSLAAAGLSAAGLKATIDLITPGSNG